MLDWWTINDDGVVLNKHNSRTGEYIFPLTPLKLEEIELSFEEYVTVSTSITIDTRTMLDVRSLQRTIITRMLLDMMVKHLPREKIVTINIDIKDISSVRLTKEYVSKIVERCMGCNVTTFSTPPPDSQESVDTFLDLVSHLKSSYSPPPPQDVIRGEMFVGRRLSYFIDVGLVCVHEVCIRDHSCIFAGMGWDHTCTDRCTIDSERVREGVREMNALLYPKVLTKDCLLWFGARNYNVLRIMAGMAGIAFFHPE